MNRFVKNTSLILLIVLIGLSVFAGTVNAQNTASGAPLPNPETNNISLWGFDPLGFINTVIAAAAVAGMALANLLVSAAGALLNVSIVVTLQIRDFVDATPAIYTIWRTIRDITGLFFIFFLLWEAIKMILNLGNSYGKLLKDIVIAGILINFSFFFVSVLIDTSNVVSQAIYNSMLPNSTVVTIHEGTKLKDLTAAVQGYNLDTGAVTNSSSGISNIFMNSLMLQAFAGNGLGKDIGDPFKIVLVSVMGIIMMITTALSFVLAAAAFVARLVILLFLLAFSPFWFASMVIPSLKKEFNYFGTLSNQLIFMPVYLLLMYAALSILNNSSIIGAASLPADANWMFKYIVLFVNFAMVIIMLNLPLLVGLKMGGMATGWMSSAMNKANAYNIWKNVGGGTSGFVGRNTVGRLATNIDKSLANTTAGNSMFGRSLRSVTTGKLASGKYLGSSTYADVQKVAKDKVKKGKEIDRANRLGSMIKSGANITEISSVIKEMNEKEKLALGADTLKSRAVISRLKKDDFDAIKKSDDFTDEDKASIADERIKTLEDAVARGDSDTIKHMVENMDGKDLFKIAGTATAPGVLTNPDLIRHLKSSQLHTLADEGLDATIKGMVGDVIRDDASMRTYGWIKSGDRPTIWA